MEIINDNSLNKNLLNEIKSKFILKQIFNNLTNKSLLQIIRYNKNLQKKLGKTKTHYKREYLNIIIEIIPEENILKNHAEILTKKTAYFPHHGIVSHGDSGYEFTFINIKKKYKSYFHIYFNDDLNEIKRDYITEKDKVSKIKVVIDYKIKSLSRLFKMVKCIKCINFIKFKNKNINNMSHLFDSCLSLKEINFSEFITKNVTDMYCMFMSCYQLESIDLSKLDTSKVRDMSNMFSGCGSIKEFNVSNFVTNNVMNMAFMFSYCSSIKELDLSNFDTSKVIYMRWMFLSCKSLKKINIINFETNDNINIEGIFQFCSKIRIKCSDNFKNKLKKRNSNLIFE